MPQVNQPKSLAKHNHLVFHVKIFSLHICNPKWFSYLNYASIFLFQTLSHMIQNFLPLHLPSQSTFLHIGITIPQLTGPKPNRPRKQNRNRFPSWRLDLKVAVPFATDRSVLVTSAGVFSPFTNDDIPEMGGYKPTFKRRQKAHLVVG